MSSFVQAFFHQLYALLPFFILIGLGYYLVRFKRWPQSFTNQLTKFLFNIAIPVMLFGVMSEFHKQEAKDPKLILAYFGGSFIVFFIAHYFSKKVLKISSRASSVFSVGTIFANNVMIGIPILMAFMGDDAIAVSAMIISFNALLLWSLVSFAIEWADHGSFSFRGMAATFKGVLKNPIIIGIMAGLVVSFSGVEMPSFAVKTIDMFSGMVAPLSLLVLGMGLAEYRICSSLKVSSLLVFFKLIIHPLVVWLCALALGLPPFETKAIVILSSLAAGMNVYLMALKFKELEDAVASAIVLSTVLSALTTPIILLLIG